MKPIIAGIALALATIMAVAVVIAAMTMAGLLPVGFR
jgi:hypothetical protein